MGFDSFIGLPERWRGRAEGYFDCGGNPPEIADPRVSCVPGWFNQTLPQALDRILPRAADCQIVVHMDADLYSATLYCLTVLGHRLPAFPVLFDEFGAGKARALRDALAAFGGTFMPRLGLKRQPYSWLPTRVFGEFALLRSELIAEIGFAAIKPLWPAVSSPRILAPRGDEASDFERDGLAPVQLGTLNSGSDEKACCTRQLA